jgi:glycosyltransferase involved in cell wall biosynthesis
MTFSIIILSHEKPKLVRQALDTAQSQSFPPGEILVMDSGALLKEIPHGHVDTITRIQHTAETPEIRATKLMPCWVLNQAIPHLAGEWIVCLCDDDLLLPSYLESFKLKLPESKDPACLYTGEMRARADQNGCVTEDLGNFMADRERGPGEMDCQVDYLQFIFNRAMWQKLCELHGGKPFPEEKEAASHADGLFMERAVSVAKAQPVPGINCLNRRTPLSAFCGA